MTMALILSVFPVVALAAEPSAETKIGDRLPEHVVTVYERTDSWKQRVRFVDTHAAYLILIDPTRKVVWRHQVTFEDGAFQALSCKTRELASMVSGSSLPLRPVGRPTGD